MSVSHAPREPSCLAWALQQNCTAALHSSGCCTAPASHLVLSPQLACISHRWQWGIKISFSGWYLTCTVAKREQPLSNGTRSLLYEAQCLTDFVNSAACCSTGYSELESLHFALKFGRKGKKKKKKKKRHHYSEVLSSWMVRAVCVDSIGSRSGKSVASNVRWKMRCPARQNRENIFTRMYLHVSK